MTSWRLLYSGKNTSYILSITTQAKTLIDFYKEGRQTINQGSKLDVKFWSISKSMALFFILSFFKKKDHLDRQGFERAYNVFTAWACWRLYLYCWLLCIGFSLYCSSHRWTGISTMLVQQLSKTRPHSSWLHHQRTPRCFHMLYEL